MSTITHTKTAKIGTLSATLPSTAAISATPQFDTSVPKSQAGSLTTRTSATAGEITATSSSHGISTGDLVDLYWSGGARYGVTVGTVDGTAIPITGGSGDDLPIAETSINVAKIVTFATAFDGDDAKGIIIKSSTDTSVDFRTSGGSALASVILVTSAASYLWFIGDDTNPLASDDITGIRCSNKSVTTNATLKIALGLDITS